MNTEKERYEKIYELQAGPYKQYVTYGHSNHGAPMRRVLSRASSILDVGCGHNEFINHFRMTGGSAECFVGIDFACPQADMIIDVTESLPFEDDQFEWVTAFDVLEHISTENISSVLAEMSRVSRFYAFSICFSNSNISIDGRSLHLTVKPLIWWEERLRDLSQSCEYKGGFFEGEWI